MDFFEVGGFGEGGGIFDAIGSLFSGGGSSGGLFDSIIGGEGIFSGLAGHGSAFESVLGNAARGSTLFEGGFARVMGALHSAGDSYLDYMIWRDMLGNKGTHNDFQSAWEKMGDTAQQPIKHVRDVVKGHAFMLQQLKAHSDKPGTAQLLAEYEALGLNLPSTELRSHTFRHLAKFMHTDTNAVSGELFKQLENARTDLKSPDKRAAYEKALNDSRASVEKLFEETGKTDWKQAYEAVANETRLRIGYPATGAQKWFNELSGNQKGALIFATVTAVGLGTYFGVKAIEERRKKHAQKTEKFASRIRHEQMENTQPATVSK